MILCNFWRLLFMKISCFWNAQTAATNKQATVQDFFFFLLLLSFRFLSVLMWTLSKALALYLHDFMHHYLSHDSKSNNTFWYMMIYGIYSLFDSHWWCWDHPWVGRFPDSLPLKSKSQIFQQFWVLKMMCADMARKMHFSIWVFQWVRQLVDICFILNWIDHNWACHC